MVIGFTKERVVQKSRQRNVLPTLKNTTLSSIEMLFGEQKFWKEHFIKMVITEVKLLKRFYTWWLSWHKIARTITVFVGLLLFGVTCFIPVPDIFGSGSIPLLLYYMMGIVVLVGCFCVIALLWIGAMKIVEILSGE
jgi:hypothetical protein